MIEDYNKCDKEDWIIHFDDGISRVITKEEKDELQKLSGSTKSSLVLISPTHMVNINRIASMETVELYLSKLKQIPS